MRDMPHAVSQLVHIFARLWFAKDEKVLVVNEQKISVRLALPALAGAFHFPLHFDDILAQDETDLQEAFHHSERNRNIVLVAAGVANKDGTMTSWLEHTVTFLCDFCHGIQILVQ